jgi:hypothetical protein
MKSKALPYAFAMAVFAALATPTWVPAQGKRTVHPICQATNYGDETAA